jgi:hypothetical protein
LIASALQERIELLQQPAPSLFRDGGEGGVNIAFAAGLENYQLLPQRRRRALRIARVELCNRIVRFTKNAITSALGTSSRSNSNRFATSTLPMEATPVTFFSGLFRLATRPNVTGSPPVLKTIGTVEVAALAATAAVMPVATSTATGTRTNSVASAGRRS